MLAFKTAVRNKQNHNIIYLFAFTRSNDVDNLELGVNEENVFWLEVCVR